VDGPKQDILKLFRNTHKVNADKIHTWCKEWPGDKHQGHSSQM